MCVRLMLPGEIALVTCPPDYAYDKFPRLYSKSSYYILFILWCAKNQCISRGLLVETLIVIVIFILILFFLKVAC